MTIRQQWSMYMFELLTTYNSYSTVVGNKQSTRITISIKPQYSRFNNTSCLHI